MCSFSLTLVSIVILLVLVYTLYSYSCEIRFFKLIPLQALVHLSSASVITLSSVNTTSPISLLVFSSSLSNIAPPYPFFHYHHSSDTFIYDTYVLPTVTVNGDIISATDSASDLPTAVTFPDLYIHIIPGQVLSPSATNASRKGGFIYGGASVHEP